VEGWPNPLDGGGADAVGDSWADHVEPFQYRNAPRWPPGSGYQPAGLLTTQE